MTTASACCDSCATTRNDNALAITCTLGAGDFKERVAEIRALATRSLRSSHRKPLQLELVYDRDALTEVRDLVAKESDCCSFLAFDLRHDDQAVRLTITAPAEALPAADELFAHFALDLAREPA